MKEISSIDFPQNGEFFYFYGQALCRFFIIQFKCRHRFINQTKGVDITENESLRSMLT
jgi:hypothetical protein